MPHKVKLSVEAKLALVQQYLKGGISKIEIARYGGVHKKTFGDWLRLYETEGAVAFLPKERNRVYSSELKMSAVKEYLAGRGSIEDLCKKYRIRSGSQLRNWINMYNAHGDFNSKKQAGGGSCMKQGRQTTQEERIQIARECIASGKNYVGIASKYKVSYQQARTWTLRYEELGKSGLEDRRGKRKKDQVPRTELEKAQIEIEQLKHKLYLAEMERDLLKKLDEIERRDAFRK